MAKYTVLRDLAQRSTRSPGAGPVAESAGNIPSEPAVDIADLSRAEVRDLSRDQEVRAIAPVMPTALIEPFADGDSDTNLTAAGDVTWGVAAVGADASARTGAGVVVAVLDTGIDATHPAFTGVELVEQDFSGSGNGDKQGHGTHCAGTIFGRDVDGMRIGVARGVGRALIGKVLDDNGSGDSDMIFSGIQWAIQNERPGDLHVARLRLPRHGPAADRPGHADRAGDVRRARGLPDEPADVRQPDVHDQQPGAVRRGHRDLRGGGQREPA